MAKTVKNTPGYSMPRLPDKWGDSERQFCIGLRDLFDTIYSDRETQDRNTEDNGLRIDETNTKFDAAVADINAHLQRTDDTLEDTIERVDDLEERMEAIDGEEGRMAAVEGRLDAIDGDGGALETIDGRMDTAEGRLDDIDGTGGALETITGRLDDIDGTGGALESIEQTMAADKQELLTRIGTLYNETYPIGIIVFGISASACPVTFGTWEAENTDPDTGDPLPDQYGHYMWRRVADPE